MAKNKFSGTALGRKIKKRDNVKEKRREKFPELCRKYKLDPEKFGFEDSSPWRSLCIAIIIDLIPGFQKNNSGNERKNTIISDYEIYAEYYPLEKAEYAFNEEKTQEWLAKKLSKRQRIKDAAKIIGCTEDKARAAIQRVENALEEYGIIALHAPELEGIKDTYIIGASKENRHSKNRKKEKILTQT